MALFPKLLVSNIEKSTKWYEKALGFNSLFKFRNQKNDVLMNHIRLNKYQDIMLIQSDSFTVGNGVLLNLLVDSVEDKLKSISPKVIVEDISEKPWNCTEAIIKDPDGYLITLTQPHLEKKDFDKLMKQTQKSYH